MRRAIWRSAATSAALACAAAGCAATHALPHPAERVTVGEFSFLLPDEPGWSASPAEPGSFSAVRLGPSQNEVYSLIANPAQAASPLPTDAASIAKIQAGLADSIARRTAGRLALQSGVVEVWSKLGTSCLQTRTVELNREPARITDGKAALFEANVLFTCSHPRKPAARITLGLSQRYEAGHEDPALEQKAEAVAATLEFLP